jgi:hypothetical protein
VIASVFPLNPASIDRARLAPAKRSNAANGAEIREMGAKQPHSESNCAFDVMGADAFAAASLLDFEKLRRRSLWVSGLPREGCRVWTYCFVAQCSAFNKT